MLILFISSLTATLILDIKQKIQIYRSEQNVTRGSRICWYLFSYGWLGNFWWWLICENTGCCLLKSMSLIPNMEFLRCLPRVIDRKMINLAPNRGSEIIDSYSPYDVWFERIERLQIEMLQNGNERSKTVITALSNI